MRAVRCDQRCMPGPRRSRRSVALEAHCPRFDSELFPGHDFGIAGAERAERSEAREEDKGRETRKRKRECTELKRPVHNIAKRQHSRKGVKSIQQPSPLKSALSMNRSDSDSFRKVGRFDRSIFGQLGGLL